MAITIYTKPGCFGCRKTAEKFTEARVAFTEVDITQKLAALEYVTEELGYSQAPIVVVDDDFHWSGLNPTNIAVAIKLAKEEVAS
ncbi:glutaredoxin family protein [Paeniglutamicibacter sp.]|uniref:glutaredoxin family protein n=1 Tax=Paeniglutamicibacter sp. TaxID=1934391 RepID=UPI0039899546